MQLKQKKTAFAPNLDIQLDDTFEFLSESASASEESMSRDSSLIGSVTRTSWGVTLEFATAVSLRQHTPYAES